MPGGGNPVLERGAKISRHADYVNFAPRRTPVEGDRSGFMVNVLVVEEDVDIRDPVALEWVVAFR